jgi:hypothetical protein
MWGFESAYDKWWDSGKAQLSRARLRKMIEQQQSPGKARAMLIEKERTREMLGSRRGVPSGDYNYMMSLLESSGRKPYGDTASEIPETPDDWQGPGDMRREPGGIGRGPRNTADVLALLEQDPALLRRIRSGMGDPNRNPFIRNA